MLIKIFSALLVVVIFMLQYNIWYSDGGQVKLDSMAVAIQQQKEQVELLKSQNKQLKKEIVLLRRHPEVLEEKAREQLGLIKKDEIFYRIIPKE